MKLTSVGMDPNGLFKIAQPGDTLSTEQVGTPYPATTAGGVGNAVFYATDTGLSTGNALYAQIDFVIAFPTIANPNIACGKWTQSTDLKTITIPCMTQIFTGITVVGINVLGSVAVGTTANGVAITALVQGKLA